MIAMLTYQDFLEIGDNEKDKADFILRLINQYKSSEMYQMAIIGEEYTKGKNRTAVQYQKMITDLHGRQYIDRFSPNHKSTSNFFAIFTTQLNQYLLSNGVTWGKKETARKLGADFDARIQKAGKAALIGGVSYGFYNFDHLEIFEATEFAPLYDEENGSLSAGVRFWQIDTDKPLRATLYEMDGYTDFLFQKKEGKNVKEVWQKIEDGCYTQGKTPYKLKVRTSEADGVEIYAGENYPTFPIVPLWGNPSHQSELVGLREKIDAYDLILNGYENDLDNAQIFWIIRGAGGMDDVDLTKFLDRLRTVKAVAPEDGHEVQPVEISIPYEARERLLDRLERQLYKDAMILNPSDIASGASTATQIRAAYEPQNVKTDQFEYCLIDFLQGILKIAGIEDSPTFTRSQIVNAQEEIQTVVSAANYLSTEYVTQKILTLLGDGDKTAEVLRQIDAENADRIGTMETDENG